MEEFLAEESHAKQAAAAAEEDSHNNDLYHVANKRDPYAFGLGKEYSITWISTHIIKPII